MHGTDPKPKRSCTQCSVRDEAICHSLSMPDLNDLSDLGHHRTIKRGEVVMWEGDASLLVGNLIEGVLKLSATTADGREQTLGIMFPADFIGRPFGDTTNHSVIALTDARICTFPRRTFEEFARDHHDLERALLTQTLTELDRTRHWMILLAQKTASERVAVFLLEMAQRLAPAPPCEAERNTAQFDLPFGRKDIADLLGLTVETVSRQFTRLRDSGLIATPSRRTIVILDKQGLEDCAESSHDHES